MNLELEVLLSLAGMAKAAFVMKVVVVGWGGQVQHGVEWEK